ncbi:MAG TPA: hypothetical protein VK034_21265 [Enhygromyxa sp.]|nr:hypothetical protein [Enhygromyxa sp.]
MVDANEAPIIAHEIVFQLGPEDVVYGHVGEPRFELLELWTTAEFFYEVSFWGVITADGSRCPIQVMFRQDDFEHVFIALNHRAARIRSGFARFTRPPHHRANLRSHALAAEFFATNVEAITWGEFPEFDGFAVRPWAALAGSTGLRRHYD